MPKEYFSTTQNRTQVVNVRRPFTLEYDGESLIVNTNFEGEVKIKIGESEFVKYVKKGRNEFELSTGKAILFGTFANVCSENYCKEVSLTIGSDFALYDEDSKLLYAKSGLGVIKTVPHPSASSSRIIYTLFTIMDANKVSLGDRSVAVTDGSRVSIYSFDTGKTIRSVKGNDVDYCCNKYAILNEDEEKIYVINEKGKVLKTIKVEPAFTEAIGINEEGVIACGSGCVFYNFKGKRLWRYSNPNMHASFVAHSKRHWYVSGDDLFIIRDGNVINKIDDVPGPVSASDEILAALVPNEVRAYDISERPWDPKPLWKRRLKVEDVAVGKGYVLVASGASVKVYDKGGRLVDVLPMGDDVASLSWNGDKLAVSLMNDNVEIMLVGDMVVKDESRFLTSSALPEELRSEEIYEFIVEKEVGVEETKLALDLSKRYGLELNSVPKSFLLANFASQGPFGRVFEDVIREINGKYVKEVIEKYKIVKEELVKIRTYADPNLDVALEKVRELKKSLEPLPSSACRASELMRKISFSKNLNELVSNAKELVEMFGSNWRDGLLECLKSEIAEELGLKEAYETLKEYESVLEALTRTSKAQGTSEPR